MTQPTLVTLADKAFAAGYLPAEVTTWIQSLETRLDTVEENTHRTPYFYKSSNLEIHVQTFAELKEAFELLGMAGH